MNAFIFVVLSMQPELQPSPGTTGPIGHFPYLRETPYGAETIKTKNKINKTF